ncbi:MAG: DUF167 domain-containing protein [Armatimonadota bacterium]|nr:DUF167 domain-containing protein [Armatimonadota bacterium]
MAGSGVNIRLKVIPNAPKSQVVGWRGRELTVKVTAPPVEGRANRELLRFLAEILGVSPADITILRGETSRRKTVQVAGITADQAGERLRPHLP